MNNHVRNNKQSCPCVRVCVCVCVCVQWQFVFVQSRHNNGQTWPSCVYSVIYTTPTSRWLDKLIIIIYICLWGAECSHHARPRTVFANKFESVRSRLGHHHLDVLRHSGWHIGRVSLAALTYATYPTFFWTHSTQDRASIFLYLYLATVSMGDLLHNLCCFFACQAQDTCLWLWHKVVGCRCRVTFGLCFSADRRSHLYSFAQSIFLRLKRWVMQYGKRP